MFSDTGPMTIVVWKATADVYQREEKMQWNAAIGENTIETSFK
jgi:hypothetical protein